MKKIGILYGEEKDFPMAFIKKINDRNIEGLFAEPAIIDKVIQGRDDGYDVIVDRISHRVPFYRAYLKNAAICGAAVINNPFRSAADEIFFNHCLAAKLGIAAPKTVIIPSREMPPNTVPASFGNLAYPLDWEGIFNYIGFPAGMKPFSGGGWKDIYRTTSMEDFFHKHSETGQSVMLLQEEIVFEEYYRCYCIGGEKTRILSYEPQSPFHLRYQVDFNPSAERLAQLESIALRINRYLGYDFNTIDLAIKEGSPYVMNLGNPFPETGIEQLGEENFEWVTETLAGLAIEKALSAKAHRDNLTWGEFIKRAVTKQPLA
ncbi:MAG: hypothetical protein JNL51_18445 [Chitinophagaceae bacterium]|nr:hypothetical protein [Chitinophagaceae bacterium]